MDNEKEKEMDSTVNGLHPKKGYIGHVRLLDSKLYTVEHFRGAFYNFALAVLQDGSYFIGDASCSPNDNYSRKLGHEIACGRALSRAVDYLTEARDEDSGELKVEAADGSLWSEGSEPLTGQDLGKASAAVYNKWSVF